MSADVLELLRRLYVNGTDVALAGDGSVRLSGKRPPDDLVAALTAHRDNVRDVLAEQGIGRKDDGFPSVMLRRYAVPSACGPQATCTRLGPCSRFLTCRPCHIDGERSARPRPPPRVTDATGRRESAHSEGDPHERPL